MEVERGRGKIVWGPVTKLYVDFHILYVIDVDLLKCPKAKHFIMQGAIISVQWTELIWHSNVNKMNMMWNFEKLIFLGVMPI
jgi:hypothetical protein